MPVRVARAVRGVYAPFYRVRADSRGSPGGPGRCYRLPMIDLARIVSEGRGLPRPPLPSAVGCVSPSVLRKVRAEVGCYLGVVRRLRPQRSSSSVVLLPQIANVVGVPIGAIDADDEAADLLADMNDRDVQADQRPDPVVRADRANGSFAAVD